eukprot:GFUD01016273.1.p1 GENE.GFUD01016273.1~~GFUD01016273.1.p1  ORF type:complete len:387 (-),score=69.86 GFUD01016273.1:41-1201(-)
MESIEMYSEIMNGLFELDLDEIIQKIFLNLDPLSLKNCKCVCSEWFEFIQKRVWNSKPANKQLKKRLMNQWKFSDPFITQYDEGISELNFLVGDDDMIVCGYTRGMARVYDVSTGELSFQLQCSSQPTRRYDEVQLDLGKTVIGSVTDTGDVTIWNRIDGTLLYQSKPHGEYESVYGIKVTDDFVLTGAGDGSLVILENIKDADGKWAVMGTRESIKLWDLEEHELVENVKPIKVKVWMLSFKYPNAFVVGGKDWNGVQIWDMVMCVQVRHILKDEKPYHNIHLNERFLTISEFNRTNNEACSVAVYDVLELIDTTIDKTNLWNMNSAYSPGGFFKQVNAVSNMTSLIVSHTSKISVLNFWKDRISLSREFLLAEIPNTRQNSDSD